VPLFVLVPPLPHSLLKPFLFFPSSFFSSSSAWQGHAWATRYSQIQVNTLCLCAQALWVRAIFFFCTFVCMYGRIYINIYKYIIYIYYYMYCVTRPCQIQVNTFDEALEQTSEFFSLVCTFYFCACTRACVSVASAYLRVHGRHTEFNSFWKQC
jgi:hypothetical protein